MSVTIAPIQESLAAFLATKAYSKIVVLADTNTRKYCYPSIKSYFPKHHLITVPAGEQHKNLQTCELIWNEMTRLELDRRKVTVESAVELDEATRQRVVAGLSNQYGPDLVVQYQINPDLLGGLRIRVGNDVFDGSVQGRLDRLAAAF